ncbi:hypothetical protein [Actinoplanes sp. NPDC051851]|uniref:hypothetical protein n=1 Tax=Actinoplanes sp. NPDC051851 TaxID=3154753 RepID=UPI00344170ED
MGPDDRDLDRGWRGLCGFERDGHHDHGSQGRHEIIEQVRAVVTVLDGKDPGRPRAVLGGKEPDGLRAVGPNRAPRLPVETWKLPLLLDTGRLLVVPRPLPEHFAAAWARVTAGKVPR